MATKETMRAVVFKGPYKIAVEERPVPKIQSPTDIIVKVKYTALCGRYVSINAYRPLWSMWPFFFFFSSLFCSFLLVVLLGCEYVFLFYI